MPVLKNARQEVFCQQVASNVAIPQAYQNAGFDARDERSAAASASKLVKSGKIVARIADLRQQIANGITDFDQLATVEPAQKQFIVSQIGQRIYRVAVLGDLLERCQIVIAERARDMKDVPGGSSGLLVRKLKVVGGAVTKSEARGKVLIERTAPEVREEYTFDSALVASIRELTKEAGIEMGQRVEQNAVSMVQPPADEPDLSGVDTATLRKARDMMERARLMLEAPDPVPEMEAEEIEPVEPGGDNGGDVGQSERGEDVGAKDLL